MWHEEIMAEKISTMKMAFHHELLNQGYGSSITKVIKEKWGQYFANNHFCTPLCSKKMAV